MNTIMSSYFVEKPDPQRKIKYAPNDFELIRVWYESLTSLGLSAQLFIDFKPDARFKKDTEKIELVEVDTIKENVSNNDARFIHYFRWLKFDIDKDSKNKYLHTDAFDVEFFKDPFDFVDMKNVLYIGNTGTWGSKPFLQRQFPFMDMKTYSRLPVYNPGTVGGIGETFYTFLSKLTISLIVNSKFYNVNLPLTNKYIYENNIPVFTGTPFATEFKKYEQDKNCYIRHK